jgi:hypothetical protein
MVKAEQKPLEDIVTPNDKPLTSRYLVAHFGNGDEDD